MSTPKHISQTEQPQKVLIYEEFSGQYTDYMKLWMQRYAPSLLDHFDFGPQGGNYAVAAFFIKDVVRGQCYQEALHLANHFQARGLPVINHPGNLDNTRKDRAADLIRPVVRTPIMKAININDPSYLNYPFIVREDMHGGKIQLIKNEVGMARLNVRAMFRPICCEFIDVSKDGWYHKYRYIAAGDNGISYHLQVSKQAIVKHNVREFDDESLALEIAYISKPDPNHAQFQKLRSILQFDFFALDYAYINGEVVIWEVNVCPNIGPKIKLTNAINRTTKCMIEMCIKHLDPKLVSVLEEGFADCMARDERKY